MFYLWISIGMISTNRPKAIKLDCIEQYKKTIKDDFLNIKDVNIYYRQGGLRIDFTVNPQMSLDGCKQVVKLTRDFIEKDTEADSIRAMIDERQLGVHIKFDLNNNVYVFHHSYWTQDTSNVQGKNSYRIWYLDINKEESVRIEI
jgi:hypothetical protein